MQLNFDTNTGQYTSQENPLVSIAQLLPFLSYSNRMSNFYQPVRNLMTAYQNPNSKTYQNIYNQQRLQGQQNLAESIAEIGRQNRVLTRMGRSPLLDNERGGETIWRNLMQGYQQNQNQAAANTYDILGNAIKNQTAMSQIQNQQAAQKAGFGGGIAGALAKLFIGGGGLSSLFK